MAPSISLANREREPRLWFACRSRCSVLAILLLFVAACDRSKKASLPTPPTPQPVVKKAPEPPAPPAKPEHLSLPQTTVVLPPEQPVDPAALETVAPPPNERTAPETPSLPARPPRPVARQTPEPAPATAAPVEQPRLQPILPESEQQRLAAEIRNRRNEIDSHLSSAAKRRLNERERGVVSRVRSFLNLSDQAAKRGDMAAADEFSNRALILSRGLER